MIVMEMTAQAAPPGEGRVRVKVVDANHEPLPGVTVRLTPEHAAHQISDERGWVDFSGLPTREYDIVASTEGFQARGRVYAEGTRRQRLILPPFERSIADALLEGPALACADAPPERGAMGVTVAYTPFAWAWEGTVTLEGPCRGERVVDETGSAWFSRLVPGVYTLRFEGDGLPALEELEIVAGVANQYHVLLPNAEDSRLSFQEERGRFVDARASSSTR